MFYNNKHFFPDYNISRGVTNKKLTNIHTY